MRAMILNKIAPLDKNPTPLNLADVAAPIPKAGEILIRISVCGVCHTELDEIEGRIPPSHLPMILGHQVVGHVEALGEGVTSPAIGTRVGVAWVYSSCGICSFCQRGEENLCPEFMATGRDAHGGYAELMTVAADFAFPLPEVFSDSEAAPLLCAGAIGYRSLRLTKLKNGQNLGLTGFGASAHLVLKLVRYLFPDVKIFVFARQQEERDFALSLGARWAGDSTAQAPEPLQAIIDTTPAWSPIIGALQNLEPGGRLVINAIRKENQDKDVLLELDYPQHLWMEKQIKSVANITRTDVTEFIAIAAKIPLKPEFQEYPLEDANQALRDMKNKHIKGAKVLRIAD